MSIAADVTDAAILRVPTMQPVVLVEAQVIPEQRHRRNVAAIAQTDILRKLVHGVMVHEGQSVQDVVDTQTSRSIALVVVDMG